tara:strand:+ start:251 stop:376 length:126 start_codon:yes stop_codon:yes gene_type:complete
LKFEIDLVLEDVRVIMEHDRRRSGLSKTQLDMEYDNNSIEQ